MYVDNNYNITHPDYIYYICKAKKEKTVGHKLKLLKREFKHINGKLIYINNFVFADSLRKKPTPQTEICKRVQFLPSLKDAIKYLITVLLIAFSLNIFAQDYYVTTSDLNLRSGAGKNYKSLAVLSKGDTVQLIENTGNYWAKIQYHDKIGYSSKQFLQKTQIQKVVQKEEVTGENENTSNSLVIGIIVLILVAIILTKLGKKHRKISLAKILSFFFGTFGFQKYYLGQTNKGTLSIMFCWTFIPAIIGLIDFMKLASMNEENFNIKYNGSITTQKQTKKEAKKASKNKVPINIKTRNKKVENASNKYAALLYKKGLYIDEILNLLIDEDYKMTNGEDITNFNQVRVLIHSSTPNATFEIKPKEKRHDSKITDSILKEKTIDKKTKKKNSTISENNPKEVESIDMELKNFSQKAYPNDSDLQEYVYKEQFESKAFMKTDLDLDSKKFAVEKYPDDYSLQEYVYNVQIKYKAFMSGTSDIESKRFAVEKYPNDYSLQEYIYKEQVEAKSFMAKTTEKEIKEFAIKEYPEDYSMQKYIYNEQIALTPQKRQKIINQSDETIIDINSEELDLTIDHPTPENEISLEKHSWKHKIIHSKNEIENATIEQQEFYRYLKEKFDEGQIVDIGDNTNYAFVLFYDLLDEYDNHKNMTLFFEQINLLSRICPKNKSYPLNTLIELYQKIDNANSFARLRNLHDPNYRYESKLEYGYSDYNPDLYKLGNQYKDKLGLDKQEIRWLNKFYNPSNVFTSIEGCCIAIIKQYVFILKELNKQLKKKETTLAKEITYFKEKLKSIYTDRYNSEWGYYDTSYISNRAESEVYLTIFKRVENSVRDSFGHKRKVSGDFPYADKNLSAEFEIRLGNFLNELISKFNNDIEKPDIETQIELNAQNVNRWKIDFNNLKDSFQKENKIKFIDGIINIEETNQKNPNIENIFFEASKFIAKYDNIQSLKYYAKYIYYDLKSKKFDNKELTKTVQKSLFKTDEQINDFKKVIAELIETSDIQKALDNIANIYIPKRKKIKLDKSVIKEVEQKHDGTVELLSEYLETENEELIQPNYENEEIEISVVPTNTNNSIFISEISIGKIQEELVKKIVLNSFEIHQKEVDKFATENGFFKNQLIDSINEACEEHLEGEALIEEDDENYVIEESYYKEIAV